MPLPADARVASTHLEEEMKHFPAPLPEVVSQHPRLG